MPTLEEIYDGSAPDYIADGLRDLSRLDLLPPALPTIQCEAPAPATSLEEIDLLRYTALFERHVRIQRELELEQLHITDTLQQQKVNGDKLGALLDALGTKYNVDFHKYRIQPDGSIIPLK